MEQFLGRAQCYGIRGTAKNSVHFVDEQTVAFPCGHATVLYNTETRDQRLIYGSAAPFASRGISALAVAPNKRLLAVAEESDERGFVSIYDTANNLKRKKVLSCAALGSERVVSVAFSADSRYCLTQGAGPQWALVLWSADKAAKVIATTKSSPLNGPAVHRADFSPNDPSAICVTGNTVLRFFRVVESQLRPVTLGFKRDLQDYTCHLWLPDDRVIVGTDAGELLVVDAAAMEFRAALASSPRGGKAARSMAAVSKGFLVGTDGGELHVYESSEDAREFYRRSHTFRLEGDASAILSMALSPSEDSMICATGSHQLMQFTLSSTDIVARDGAAPFEHLLGPLHGPGRSGATGVTGIATCSWKPLVATCGADRRVRLWNYQERVLEHAAVFEQEPTCLALHPTGFYMLVGFAESVRYMALLMDDLRVVKEWSVKGARKVAFSGGGSLFAVAANASVLVYNAFTAECLHTLRGHNARVRSIDWRRGDKQLMSAGMDGMVFLWTFEGDDVQRDEISVPRTALHAGAASADFGRAFAYGSDLRLHELSLDRLSVRRSLPVEAPVAEMLFAKQGRVLLTGAAPAGARPGTLRAALLPALRPPAPPAPADAGAGAGAGAAPPEGALGSEEEGGGSGGGDGAEGGEEGEGEGKEEDGGHLQFCDFRCHGAGVTCMALSTDGSLLFSGAEDGSFFVHEVAELTDAGEVRAREAAEIAGDFTEEILVTKGNMERQQERMERLKERVEELKLNNEHQLRMKDATYRQKVQEVRDRFCAELEADQRRRRQLQEEKRARESGFEERLRQLETAHREEFSGLEEQYKAKVLAEVQRYEQLVAEKEEQSRQWDARSRELAVEHGDMVRHLTAEYDERLEGEQQRQQALAASKREVEGRFRELRDCIEADADTEVEALKARYEVRLASEREATARLAGENNLMKKRAAMQREKVKDHKNEISLRREGERDKLEKIRGLMKDISGHKKEIREREETIADKEQRIYDLKKKNQELEKFKFVLDYKIRELRRQIEPRENEITEMRAQIEEMDLELEQYHKSNAALDLMIGELRLKMDGMQRELNAQRGVLKGSRKRMADFCADLQALRAHLGSHRQLKPAVVALFHRHILEDSAGDRGSAVRNGPRGCQGADLQAQYNHQREHLERNVDALKRNIVKDLDMQSRDRARLMRESAQLTEELNRLRREAKGTQMAHHALMRSMAEQGVPPEAVGVSAEDMARALGTFERSGRAAVPAALPADPYGEVERQAHYIAHLQARLADLEQQAPGA